MEWREESISNVRMFVGVGVVDVGLNAASELRKH